MQKWNPEKEAYEPYTPPNEDVTVFEADMDKVISCARCGKRITFGEGYTSLHIHSEHGFGYTVCEQCHSTEIREKVIKGLEHCSNKSFCNDSCPYSSILRDPNFGIDECMTQLAHDALELLKEQEPRVIRRDELKQFEGSPCWFESHGTYMGKEGFWIIPYMLFTCCQTMYYVFPLLSANERGDIYHSKLGLSAYNKAWRCWTSRPTEEQRKAVKWE